MLAALTRIDRHESCFAAKRSSSQDGPFDRSFPTKGVIAGYDHHKLTFSRKLPWSAHQKEAPDRGAEPRLPVPLGGTCDGEGKPITTLALLPLWCPSNTRLKPWYHSAIIPSVRNPL